MSTVQGETKALLRKAVQRASLAPVGSQHPAVAFCGSALVTLDPMIDRRHTNRRDFFDQDVPPDVIYELTTAAEQEEAALVQIVKPEHKMVAAQLSEEAEAIQSADDRYRPELETWTTTDLHRTDGVPVYAIPHTDQRSEPEAWFATSTSPARDGCRG